MEFCVIDKNAGKVVVYCRGMIEGNPRSEEALREHVNHILKDFQQIKIE